MAGNYPLEFKYNVAAAKVATLLFDANVYSCQYIETDRHPFAAATILIRKEANMEQKKQPIGFQSFADRQWIPYALFFFYGLAIGGCITLFVLDTRLRQIWTLTGSNDVPIELLTRLLKVSDDIFGYYFVYGMVLVILVVLMYAWLYSRRRKGEL